VLGELRVATSQVTQAAERCRAMSRDLAAAHAERDGLRLENAALNADKELLLALGQRAAAALEERRREAELAGRVAHAEQVSLHAVLLLESGPQKHCTKLTGTSMGSHIH